MGNYSRSRTAWKEVDDPPTLHDARYTFDTYMIFAGCNAKALSVVMGHEDITTTFNIYGQMMPGGEHEVGRLLGVYLQGTQQPDPEQPSESEEQPEQS